MLIGALVAQAPTPTPWIGGEEAKGNRNEPTYEELKTVGGTLHVPCNYVNLIFFK